MKKIIALVMALALAVSLCACGGTNKGEVSDITAENGLVLKNDSSVSLGTPAKTLDPTAIYDSITYTPEMFRGRYRLLGGDEAAETYADSADFFTCTIGDTEYQLTKLPHEFECGKNTMTHSVNYIEEHNWIRLHFMQKTDSGNYLVTFLCAYTIEGNTLYVTPLNELNVDQDNNKITYALSDTTFEYNFKFEGTALTLSADGSSITLNTGLDVYDDNPYFCVDSYLSPDSKRIGNIDEFNFLYSTDGYNRITVSNVGGETAYDAIAKLEDNGLFTFTAPFEESSDTYQFVYFYCGNDGLVLTDGESYYYYNDNYSDHNAYNLKKYVSEDRTAMLDDLSDSELEAIVEKKDNLLEDLTKAFEDAGIAVTINAETGELAMDSSVLFGGDSAVLTDEGKTLLNKFTEAYVNIVFSEKYQGFIEKTMVEGHTAPVGSSTYEDGLPLSIERADNVKNYCISTEIGIDTTKLSETLESVGYSNSKPIYDEEGNVDMAASRRVSFRFILNLD